MNGIFISSFNQASSSSLISSVLFFDPKEVFFFGKNGTISRYSYVIVSSIKPFNSLNS
jgi:hypothetical protein